MNPLLIRRRGMMASDSPEFHRYLVFDGTAYIDTDIVPNGNQNTFNVSIGHETVTSGVQHVYDFLTSNGRIRVSYGSATTPTTRSVNAWYDNGVNSAVTMNVNFSISEYRMVLTPYRLFCYSYSSTLSSPGNGVVTSPIVLGAITGYSGQAFSGRMSRFRVYGPEAKNITIASQIDNYTPFITLHPCIYKGEAGMWYVQGNKFYGNTAGAGTLTVAD